MKTHIVTENKNKNLPFVKLKKQINKAKHLNILMLINCNKNYFTLNNSITIIKEKELIKKANTKKSDNLKFHQCRLWIQISIHKMDFTFFSLQDKKIVQN